MRKGTGLWDDDTPVNLGRNLIQPAIEPQEGLDWTGKVGDGIGARLYLQLSGALATKARGIGLAAGRSQTYVLAFTPGIPPA